MRPPIREWSRYDLLLIAGTRPEALKLEPLAAAWHGPLIQCWTGQQTDIPIEAKSRPWLQLATLPHPMHRAALIDAIRLVIAAHLRRSHPRAVVVQGDTASAYAGALAAVDLSIPVIHLEAGLRSYNLRSPFPEEAYRRNITRMAALHLAPSALASRHLISEGVCPGRIAQVGSTAIDGLRRITSVGEPVICDLLVDIHRRENSGRALRRLAATLKSLASAGRRICIAAQPNGNWSKRWSQVLGAGHGLFRLPLLNREGWLAQSKASHCVLSDSGAAAEELPYLGVPLLVYRFCTERPEAISSGHARLLSPWSGGSLDAAIESALGKNDWPAPWPLSSESPYGDGHAGTRAASAIAAWLTETGAKASAAL